jgi:hypothetical protein
LAGLGNGYFVDVVGLIKGDGEIVGCVVIIVISPTPEGDG